MKFTDLKKIPTDRGRVWLGLAIILAMYGGAKYLSPDPTSGLWALPVALGLFGAAFVERHRPAKPPQVEKYNLFA